MTFFAAIVASGRAALWAIAGLMRAITTWIEPSQSTIISFFDSNIPGRRLQKGGLGDCDFFHMMWCEFNESLLLKEGKGGNNWCICA